MSFLHLLSSSFKNSFLYLLFSLSSRNSLRLESILKSTYFYFLIHIWVFSIEVKKNWKIIKCFVIIILLSVSRVVIFHWLNVMSTFVNEENTILMGRMSKWKCCTQRKLRILQQLALGNLGTESGKLQNIFFNMGWQEFLTG